MVLNFHGRGGNPSGQFNLSGFRPLAERDGFILVGPEGTGEGSEKKSWNAGVCCGVAYRQQIDDAGFVRRILDLLATRMHVDLRRVYATGFSNGARLSHRLACELSERIAAIAPVAGVITNFGPASSDPLGDLGAFRCEPRRPVVVLEFHGMRDTCSPYNGGPGSAGDVNNLSAEFSAKTWSVRNHCGAGTPAPVLGPSTRCVQASGCVPGSDVLLCTLVTGGHVWPGGDPYQGWQACGGTWPRDYSGASVIWEFFKAHPRR